MNTAQIINLILGIVAVIVSFLGYYFYIRGKAYKAAQEAVNDAEPENGDAEGKEKLETAVSQVYALIPVILKPIITREVVRGIVQAAFDKIEEYAKKQVKKKGQKEE